MKPKTKRFEIIDATRIVGNQIHILGYNASKNPFLDDTLYHITCNISDGSIVKEDSFREKYSILPDFLPKQKEGRRKTKEYNQFLRDYKDTNMKDLENGIKDIRVYQDSKNNVEGDLGRNLERVETGKPETFIYAENLFLLRVKAYSLGADAVVNYRSNPSVGTPVKYSDKK